MKYILSKLGYQYDALEPYIDARTMEIHHSKHYQAYVDKLNATGVTGDLESLLRNLNQVPEDIRMAVRNNGGGVWNHDFFFKVMGPKKTKPEGKLLEAIKGDFGGLEKMQEQFNLAAVNRFGSGWVWLVTDKGKLSIMSTPNQDNPLMEGKKPILALDVWEHAYYILYKWERAKYVEQWWQVVNWEAVEINFKQAV